MSYVVEANCRSSYVRLPEFEGANDLYMDTCSVLLCSMRFSGVISINGSTITTIANAAQCPSDYSMYKDTACIIYAACGYASCISVNVSTITTDIAQCYYAYREYKDTSTGVLYAVCGSAGGNTFSIIPSSCSSFSSSSTASSALDGYLPVVQLHRMLSTHFFIFNCK